MENLQGMGAPTCEIGGYWFRPCAMAFAVAMALGLSACGGGGGGNVRPTSPPPAGGTTFSGGEIDVEANSVTVLPDSLGGSINLIKGGAGTLTLTGSDSYTGGTTVNLGTLQIGNGGTTGSLGGNVTDNAVLAFDRSDDISFGGIVSGSGSLKQIGAGTLILTGSNTYTGGTTISSGTLQIGDGYSSGSLTGNVTDNAVLAFYRGDAVTFDGIISGSGSLKQIGNGTLILTGGNTYTGGTTVSSGTLQVGNGGTTGSIVGDVETNSYLVFDRSDDVTFDGVVSGANGSLLQSGTGTLIVTGANTYMLQTLINSGTLQVGNGGTSGNINGNIFDNGMLAFDRSDDISFANPIAGSGGLIKIGSNSLTLTGDNRYTGSTQVQAGSVYVDGDQSNAIGATTVGSGATLGGKGIVGGNVTVADGATLAPGSKGAIGTLTINGNLNLSSGSTLNFDFGPPPAAGSQLSDLVYVRRNLTLDGTLNVNVEQGGDLGPGIHRLFNYDGTLTDNGLNLGSMPSSGWAVQTGVPNQINLVNTQGLVFSFWDGAAGPKGNNVIDGGDGVWRNGSALSNHNWTDAGGAVNAAFTDGSFAVFQGTGGRSATVTVDAGSGDMVAAGMQFASNSYFIQGGAIRLVGGAADPTQSIIRVGDGSISGQSYVATINSALRGDTTLVKTDAGTLVLGGNNDYTGGTTISGGVLQIGNGGVTGSIIGNVTDNASLVFDRLDYVTLNNIVSGSGSLTQAGTGKLILTDANTYTGGTVVTGGTLEIAPGATIGTGSVTVGIDNWTPSSSYTLQVDHGASLSNRIVLDGLAKLDNAGTIGGNVDFGVEGEVAYNAYNSQVLNHDGGSIEGNIAGLTFNSDGISVTNNSGGVIEGGNAGVRFGYGGSVTNDGVGSTISSPQIAIQSLSSGFAENRAGGTITGGLAAIDFLNGGYVNNIGPGSTISSAGGSAIEFTTNSGTVDNDGGATITSGKTALYMEQGGSVTNSAGSTIETTGAVAGDCAATGICAIFVASNGQANGALDLINAGSIVGNVQLNPTASNDITLSAGSSIHGDLDIGSNHGASLSLNGDVGTQLYSQAVTGVTTFAGDLSKRGAGTWIIDSNDLTPDTTTISGGTLQIGNGGTDGSIGPGHSVIIYGGSLVFDRSDNVTFNGSISSEHSEAYNGTLVQAGSGVLTLLMANDISPTQIVIANGTLQIDNTGSLPTCLCSSYLMSSVEDDSALVFNSNWTIFAGGVTGTGSVTQNGSGSTILQGQNTYSGGTTINQGALYAGQILPGNVTVNAAGLLGGFTGVSPFPGLPGVAGSLVNAGKVSVRLGDSLIGNSYTQTSTGTLAVSLGSKLAVTGPAAIAGTLEITGADSGYVSNTHTNVLTAIGGVSGTFSQLVKDAGVVFTATTIHYDANSVWLDTTGLNITNAITTLGGSFTPASFGSAQRVQSAFTQLDSKIAAGSIASVSKDFVQAAGQFQQAPTVQVAQASLQSLSGQLHAASAAMTFEAIDASSRALSDRFDDLLGKNVNYGMWTHSLSMDGDMSRSGYDGVGFQLNGWLVGEDRQIGRNGVAGFAFGQSQGRQQLDQSYDRNHNRSTEGMFYAGWLNGNWYTQGRVGFGYFQQDVNRQVLLGYSAQGVSTDYNGNYNVAYGESGLHLNWGGTRLMPFVDMQYATIARDGFAEQGAGGFGLRSGAQNLDRLQAGVGMRANHHWDLGEHRALDFNASAQWQRTLASHGDVFDASFVGMQQWQPLEGIGLSRYSGVLDVGLDATLSKSTALKFGYEYETGQRDEAQTLSARVIVAF